MTFAFVSNSCILNCLFLTLVKNHTAPYIIHISKALVEAFLSYTIFKPGLKGVQMCLERTFALHPSNYI
ncbi:hypothetical protein XELAEV_18001747mg [Xenopus laevis]|nr:hypothetical protein XELAEV_18001747mg [Xenopus laevis]